MAPGGDEWALINGRFQGQDDRISAHDRELDELGGQVDTFKSTVAQLRQEVSRMTDSFQALRTALYATAATIIAAAVLLVVLGGSHA